ncbi:MAG: hypothetical protein JWQ64_993 [Subtercola sp.]|nr:hypothetical protein [Subtercola sp.]
MSRIVDGYVFAAYNAAPSDLGRQPELEQEWYERLRNEPLIGGLELSFDGELHERGAAWLSRLLSPEWKCLVTNIPGTLSRLQHDTAYGLASTSPDARAAAVADVLQLLDEVDRLNQAAAHQQVVGVELHSAPRADVGASSVEALIESLVQIVSSTAASGGSAAPHLVLEHADALVPGQTPVKGFLGLGDEVAVARRVFERTGVEVGQGINWGRSAIETRSATGPRDHLAHLAKSQTLRGLTFSGVAGAGTGEGTAWHDTHRAAGEWDSLSILSTDQIITSFESAAPADLWFTGVKVGAAADAVTLEQRLAPGMATLELVARCEPAR